MGAFPAAARTRSRYGVWWRRRHKERQKPAVAPAALVQTSYLSDSLPTFEVRVPTFGVRTPTFEVSDGHEPRCRVYEIPANPFLFPPRSRNRRVRGHTDLWSNNIRPLKEELPTSEVNMPDLWSKDARPLKEEFPTFGVRTVGKMPAKTRFFLPQIGRLVLALFFVCVVFNNTGLIWGKLGWAREGSGDRT